MDSEQFDKLVRVLRIIDENNDARFNNLQHHINPIRWVAILTLIAFAVGILFGGCSVFGMRSLFF